MNAFTLFAVLFMLFALSRAFLQYRNASISIKEFGFWLLFWVSTIVIVVWPGQTARFANVLGISRGADVVVYAAIIGIYYLAFRMYVQISTIDHNLTRLVRSLALKEDGDQKK